MSTITAGSLIDRVSLILQDMTNVRWTRAELLGWFNDGEREVVLYKPNAYVKRTSAALVPGVKQTVPADCIGLIDVPRNTGGAAIWVVSREILDAHSPDWYLTTPSAVIKHYMHNSLDPKTYLVYPPSNGIKSNVDLVYSASPVDIGEGAVILVEDVHATAIMNYMLYRAYSKDAEYAANAELAAAYYGQVATLLGAKVSAEAATSPNSTKK